MFKSLVFRASLALLTAGMLSAAGPGAGQESRLVSRAPVPIIFDSDIGPDVDDAGTTAVLNALADLGEARILAMNCCTSSDWGAPCLEAINTWYGRKEIPIGTFKGAGFLVESKYNREVAERFPNRLKNGQNAPDATEVYRKTLAAQPDRSVVICAVGPLNNLHRLLDSGPDRHSKLPGRDLVNRKVLRLVIMGGRYPEGKEWNLEQDPRAASVVLSTWPTPILASGFEIGAAIKTGARLHTEAPEANPVRAAYALYVGAGKDRESWDQTALVAAIRGAGTLWKLSENGSIAMDETSKNNRWTAEPRKDRYFLLPHAPVEQVKKSIEDLMVRPPSHGKK